MSAQHLARRRRSLQKHSSKVRVGGTRSALGIITALFVITTTGAQADSPPLSSVVIQGSSVYDAPELFLTYKDQLGKPASQSGVRAIAAALERKYESDGYARPQLRVDDALIAAGVLRIRVNEPRFSEVRISGNPGPHLETLENLGAALRDHPPVRQRDVAATLRRMEDLPGLTVSASTEPDGTEPHAYRLNLSADFEPVGGSVQVSNRGTDEAGPNFVLGRIMANGLFAGDTNLGVQFAAATDYDEYHGIGALADVGLGESGGRMSFLGFRSRSNPHEPVDRDDVHLRDRVLIRFGRPAWASAKASASFSAALDLDNLLIDRSGTVLRDERLRMVDLGMLFGWRNSTATRYSSSFNVVKGLDGLGSGLEASDLTDDPRRADFLLTRMSFMRLTTFSELWSTRLDVFGQQSAYVLPYEQRFKIGGDRLGRGFEVAEIAGDQGIGAKVELRRQLARASQALGRASVHAFYDVGAAWKQDMPGRESAATFGIGFSIQNRRVSGTLELAQPLTHPDVEGSDDLNLFVQFSMPL